MTITPVHRLLCVLGLGLFSVLPVLAETQVSPTPEAPRGPVSTKSQRMEKGKEHTGYSVAKSLELIGQNLKPGMTVLDFGAGLGEFAFQAAERLGGQGTAFATEVDPEMVTEMKKAIEAKGIRNVVPVLVGSDGLDPFYAKHKFDLVMASKVYHYLGDPVKTFSELRKSLNPGARVYLIHYKPVSEFNDKKVPAVYVMGNQLRALGKDTPIYKKLAPEMVRGILNWKKPGDSPELMKLTAESFNKLLADRTLFKDQYAYDLQKNIKPGPLKSGKQTYTDFKKDFAKFWDDRIPPADRSLAQWLVDELEQAGAFDPSKKLSEKDETTLRVLNGMMIMRAFYPIAAGSTYMRSKTYVASKPSVIASLERAGLSFVAEQPYSPELYFLEFQAADKQATNKR